MNELVKLKDCELLDSFSQLVIKEREVISEVVSYVAEIRIRKLYAQMGYSSLFSFLIEKCGYSGGAAYRRIQACKVVSLFPEALEDLRCGRLNLMALSLIESHVTQENGKDLLKQILGKKKEEIEYYIATVFSKPQKTKDKIRRLPVIKSEHFHGGSKAEIPSFHFHSESKDALSQKEPGQSTKNLLGHKEADKALELCLPLCDTGKNKVQEIRRVKIEFVAEEAVAKMIERAKELLRHKYPEGKLEDLVREAFELLLEKKDPERKILKQETKEILRVEPAPAKQTGTQNKTRYIPQEMKLQVWKRDQGQCSYVSPEGKKCLEKNFLEMDHVHPWGLGGDSSINNLRLLCKTHNQWRAEKTFGVLNPAA